MRAIRVGCVGALALALCGCGGALTVSGTVTRGGAPLASGTITFEPEPGSGTAGPGASTAVRDGEFKIRPDQNLLPGRYVVRIGPEPLGSGADLRTAPPQFRPWETAVELKPGGGPLMFDVPVR